MQRPNPNQVGGHAIVLGGSIAGLFATRVLADHFESVTLIDRDRMREVGGEYHGVPQARHVHVLLAKGLEIAAQLFPDLVEALQQNGATEVDFGTEMRWHHFGGFKTQCRGSVKVLSQSRSLLEHLIRERVTGLSNVTVLSKLTVNGLLSTPDQKKVIGVKLSSNPESLETLSAELVVDATGRNSLSLQWLELLGYQRPEQSEVIIKVGYASRIYRRNSDDLDQGKGVIIAAHPPEGKRGGVIAPIEGDRWLVTLVGYLGDHPPIDNEGFLVFAQSLAVPDIYNLLAKSEPLSEPIPHKYPSSLRHHYEKLTRFPEGYLVVGDALCSFNPIFGQGMTVAALEAQILDECLKSSQSQEFKDLSQRFFTESARVIDTPWNMTLGEDIRYPDVVALRSLKTTLINWYISRIYQASHDDALVYRAFIQVMHLMRSPTTLFNPLLLFRVLRGSMLGSFLNGSKSALPRTHDAVG